MNAVTDADQRDGGPGGRGPWPPPPNFGLPIISVSTWRQQIMPPICLLPPPSDYQTFRRPCDRPRFRSWGGQKPKQLNTSCSQYTTRIARVKYPKYKCEKAEKTCRKLKKIPALWTFVGRRKGHDREEFDPAALCLARYHRFCYRCGASVKHRLFYVL